MKIKWKNILAVVTVIIAVVVITKNKSMVASENWRLQELTFFQNTDQRLIVLIVIALIVLAIVSGARLAANHRDKKNND